MVSAMVAVEAEARPVIEEAEAEVGLPHMDHNNRRKPKRRISSISPSIWTSRYPSSSMAAGKVCGSCAGADILHGLLTQAVIGTLKGYDQLMNLVLDDVKETMRGRHRKMQKASPPPVVHFIDFLGRRRRQSEFEITGSDRRTRHSSCSHISC